MQGVLAPVLTPFDSQLNPDEGRFVSFCRKLLDDGCAGLVPFGTTGEANSLSVEERERLLDALLEGGVPAEKLIPGTGCAALPDTVRLSKKAARAGCAGVLVLPPFYYKNPSEEGLYRSFAQAIDKTGEGRLRVYLYHIPGVPGRHSPAADRAIVEGISGRRHRHQGQLARAREHARDAARIPRIRGVRRDREVPPRHPAGGRSGLHHRDGERERAGDLARLPRAQRGAAARDRRRARGFRETSPDRGPERSDRAAHRRCPVARRPAAAGRVVTRPASVAQGNVKPLSCSRSADLRNFPVAVRGICVRKTKASGSQNLAKRGSSQERSSPSEALAPSLRTTHATGRSDHFGCETATTAASFTAGWPIRAFSISTELIHSPPLLIRSLERSVMRT